jgi:AraC-like DNA-binding protein
MKKTPYPSEYHAWRMMRYRCTNPKSPDWDYYGGRGIKVCERWNSYENFLADMGKKPSPGLKLERLDNDRGYSKDNCAWETHQHQMKNRRRFGGICAKITELLCLPLNIKEICGIVGVSPQTYRDRVMRVGMNPAQALLTPVKQKQK